MRITAIEVFLLDLPLREPFVASHGETLARTITAISIDTDVGTGWGECSALPAPTYTAEFSAGAYNRLTSDLAPRLIGQAVTSEDVLALLADAADQPMTLACVEMAVLDAELRAAGRSLAEHLGSGRTSVEAGVSIGLDSVAATVHRAESLAADGYRRFKVKIQPGHDVALVGPLRRSLPDIELHVDANGAYRSDSLDLMEQIADLGVDAFEQPFSPEEQSAAAGLIKRLDGRDIAVVADEAVASLPDAHSLMDAGAMTGLSIKPSRVGGMAIARKLHDLCVTNGLAATAGGMLETGLGRHGLVALAGLPGFSLIGDLSPASRWLADDPWPDLSMSDGRIAVPTDPGVAPSPDLDTLDRYVVERLLIDRPA